MLCVEPSEQCSAFVDHETLSSSSDCPSALSPVVFTRRHWHMWQSLQFAPAQHPPRRRKNLHGLAQLWGWPMVPPEVAEVGLLAAPFFALPSPLSGFLAGRTRLQWHSWQSKHDSPARQPDFFQLYLHGLPQVWGWPTVPSLEREMGFRPAWAAAPGPEPAASSDPVVEAFLSENGIGGISGARGSIVIPGGSSPGGEDKTAASAAARSSDARGENRPAASSGCASARSTRRASSRVGV
mmetsp:Transcript_46041/g.121637  ORF Transcript_46041/g.121637 Transcript_46041/m.121637 type:complete len:239 (-) Transcript_46041:367-1083(-)